MPTASTPLSWTLIAALSILLFAGPALAEELDDELLADERKEVDADFTEQEAEPVAAEPERMKALSDLRWSKPKLPSAVDPVVPPVVNDVIAVIAVDRSPLSLSGIGDLVFLRPATAALGVLAAATYGVAAGPTLIFDPSKHDALRDDLLYGPWRNLRDRPLGEPTPVAEPAETTEPTETAEPSETTDTAEAS